MLKKLIIHHFKSLENVEIDFSNISIFVGNNASGKSNVIDAIRLVRDATTNGLDRAFGDRHGIGSVRQWSPTKPFRMSFTIFIDEATNFHGRYHFAIDTARSEFRVVREEAEIYEHTTGFTEEEDKETGDTRLVEREIHSKKVFVRDIKGNVEFTEWDYETPMDDDTQFDVDIVCQFPAHYDQKPNKRTVRVSQSDELLLNVRPHFWEFGSLRTRLANFQAYSIFPNTLRMPQEPSNETFLAPEGRNLASVFKRMRARRKAQMRSIR
jgi:predicted ATPase